jgi:type IV secretory pathway VirB3-like protein
MAEIIIVALAILVGIGLIRLFPGGTRIWFYRIVAARRILFLLFGILIGLVFLSSGSPLLMFIGFLGVLYAVLYIRFEEPHTGVLEWIKR